MLTQNKRFSKATLAEYIRERLNNLPAFDRGNGWAQVKGKGEDASRSYGEYRILIQLADDFELEV